MNTKSIVNFTALAKDSAWTLLRKTSAPTVLGILNELIFNTDKNTVSADIFIQRVEQILTQLRADNNEWLNPTKYYINQWKENGFLTVVYLNNNSDEHFELTAKCITAIEYVNRLNMPYVSVNESRLSSIMGLVSDLDYATDENPSRRLESLLKQKNEIDEDIGKIRDKDGLIETLNEHQSLERARVILKLVDGLAYDFDQLKKDIVKIMDSFMVSILEQSKTDHKKDILNQLFDHLDKLKLSSPGKSFFGFWNLLNNDELNTEFKNSLANLISREFFLKLETNEQRALSNLIRNLRHQGSSVNKIHTKLSKALYQFVVETNMAERRYYLELIKDCQKMAFKLKNVIAAKDKVTSITLPKFNIEMVGGISRTWDHFDASSTSQDLINKPQNINVNDIIDIVNSSEINFKQLHYSIKKTIKTKQKPVSIREICQQRPIKQGMGSVLGYIILADEFGSKKSGYEKIEWYTQEGKKKYVDIPVYVFESISQELWGNV